MFRQIGESGGRNVGINYLDLWLGAVLTDRGAGITKKTEIRYHDGKQAGKGVEQ